MINKEFWHGAQKWTIVGTAPIAEPTHFICTNGRERGSWRFSFDEVRQVLEKQNGSPAK